MFETGLEALVEKVADFQKEAIGQRQQDRMREALKRMDASGTAFPSTNEWTVAKKHLTPLPDKDPRLPLWREEEFQAHFSPPYIGRTGDKLLDPFTDPVRIPKDHFDKVLTSGRHHASDVVNIPFLDDVAAAHAQPGVFPEHVAWRAHKGEKNVASVMGEAAGGKGPRWTSALPSVSGGYAKQRHGVSEPNMRLNAYSLGAIPDGAQGPWTPHIANDPRGTPQMDVKQRNQRAGKSSVGGSPLYEKVIDAEHMPAPIATYKPLPSGKFQRVQGRNLLTPDARDYVKTLPAHKPTAKDLHALSDLNPSLKPLLMTPRPGVGTALRETASSIGTAAARAATGVGNAASGFGGMLGRAAARLRGLRAG